MMSRNAWQEKCKFSHLTNTCEYFAKCGKSWLSSQSRLQQTRMISSRTFMFISILLHLPFLTSSTRTSSSDSDFITIVRIEIRTLCDTTSAGKATNVPVRLGQRDRTWQLFPAIGDLSGRASLCCTRCQVQLSQLVYPHNNRWRLARVNNKWSQNSAVFVIYEMYQFEFQHQITVEK